MNKIYKYLLVLSFAMVAPFCAFSQTHSFTDLVYDSNDDILYQLNGDIVSTSGSNTITINVTDENGAALTSGDVEVYRNTIARHVDRVRITTPVIPLDVNGQAVFTDDDASISTSDPYFYSVKINGNNCQRAYPGIYLPNAPEDVTVETIGSSTITTSVYPNPSDFTAILAVEYAPNTDFVTLLESTGVIPIYPAGNQPVYYQEVLVDSDDNPSGRVNVNGSDFLFWGHEGVTYLKITVPSDKVPVGGTSYAWLKSGRNRGNSSTPIPIRFGPQVPTLTGTIHEVEDTIYNGSTVLYTVSIETGSDGTTNTNTLIFSLKDPSGDDVQSGTIDLFENAEAKLGGRTQIGNDLPISGGYVVYEHTGVAEFTPIYYSIKVNNDKNSSRTYPAIDLPALQGTTVDASIPLTTKVYPLDDGNNTVILQLDITDHEAFQALLSTPLKPAEGSQFHYSRVYSDTDPDPAGRVQIPGLIARWGSEGVTYVKTVLDTPPSENYYMWVKDGLNVGESTTPIHVIMDPPEPELPTLTGTIHSVEDTIFDGSTELYYVSVEIGSDGTTNTLIINVTDTNGDNLSSGNIDLYENDEARLNGRVQIGDDLPISLGHVVYEHTGVAEYTPIYYSIKVNNDKNSSRTYPAIDLPALQGTTVDASIPLTTKVYPLDDGNNTVILQLDITDHEAFQALLSTPLKPAEGSQFHYSRIYSDTDPDPNGRVQIPGLIARWGSEGVTYVKTVLDTPPSENYYMWVKDGLNVGESTTPIHVIMPPPEPELPTLTGTIHSVEDTIFDGSTELYYVSVEIGSDGTTNTLIINVTDTNGDNLSSGNIDLYENDEARLSGRTQIGNDLPISLGHVVYEHTGVAEFTPKYYSIKVNNDKNSSRTYPAINLPALQNTIVDASIPLTTKVYSLDDGIGTVILQLDITDDEAFQALLSTPLKPAEGSQVHYSKIYSDTDPDPNGRVQIPGLIARWGSEGVTYVKTTLDPSNNDTYYLWFKDGLNVGESTTPVPVDPGAPLPIELLSFGAKATADEQVEISWSTASEFAHSHFVIEESEDARTFESIGEVKSDGDSYTIKEYSYLDENPKYDLIFYRLKSVDLDGSLQFSNIVSVRLESSKSKINVYPNPIQGELFIDGIENGGQIIIFNSIGKVVKNINTASNKISLGDLPNGIYFIDITTKKSKLTQKIFITK